MQLGELLRPRQRRLNPFEFEPALALEAPLLLWLLVELQKQLELVLVPQLVELLMQG